MDQSTAIELIDRYLTGVANRVETERFFHLLESDPAFLDQFHKVLEEQYREGVFVTEPNEKLRQVVQARLQAAISETGPEAEKGRVIPWSRYMIAACLILLAGLGAYFLFFHEREQAAKPAMVQVQPPSDVAAPETARATITLSSGEVIYLDSAGNGSLADVGNVQIVKQDDGKVLYSGAAQELVYHTLTNPRGSKVIDMTLADGTRVWLNAGSSLRYPVAFVGEERKVSVSGEAYFEVTHNAAMPFKVNVSSLEVEVLGTHFNINAYEDEESIKTTLLEGSVRVSSGDTRVLLKPGLQARLSNVALKNGEANLKVVRNVDLEGVIAWRNGYFSFEDANIETIMRQLSRWYDLDVSYEGDIKSEAFSGKIQNNMSLQNVLEVLSLSQIVVKVDGRKLTISAKKGALK